MDHLDTIKGMIDRRLKEIETRVTSSNKEMLYHIENQVDNKVNSHDLLEQYYKGKIDAFEQSTMMLTDMRDMIQLIEQYK